MKRKKKMKSHGGFQYCIAPYDRTTKSQLNEQKRLRLSIPLVLTQTCNDTSVLLRGETWLTMAVVKKKRREENRAFFCTFLDQHTAFCFSFLSLLFLLDLLVRCLCTRYSSDASVPVLAYCSASASSRRALASYSGCNSGRGSSDGGGGVGGRCGAVVAIGRVCAARRS